MTLNRAHTDGAKMPCAFVWADLSSYDAAEAESFYSALFGWQWHKAGGGDYGDYRYALKDGEEAAGLYTMPEKFAQIKMPPFWMSHIAVADAAQTAALAEQSGGKVEVQPAPFANGSIALIRDPSGAGFTIYDGGGVNCKGKSHGKMSWNELFLPDAQEVRAFYKTTFNWQMQASGEGQFKLLDETDTCAATIQEAPDAPRGNKQYWAIHFAVDSLKAACEKVTTNGGKVWQPHTPDKTFAASPGGEFFILAERES